MIPIPTAHHSRKLTEARPSPFIICQRGSKTTVGGGRVAAKARSVTPRDPSSATEHMKPLTRHGCIRGSCNGFAIDLQLRSTTSSSTIRGRAGKRTCKLQRLVCCVPSSMLPFVVLFCCLRLSPASTTNANHIDLSHLILLAIAACHYY